MIDKEREQAYEILALRHEIDHLKDVIKTKDRNISRLQGRIAYLNDLVNDLETAVGCEINEV